MAAGLIFSYQQYRKKRDDANRRAREKRAYDNFINDMLKAKVAAVRHIRFVDRIVLDFS